MEAARSLELLRALRVSLLSTLPRDDTKNHEEYGAGLESVPPQVNEVSF